MAKRSLMSAEMRSLVALSGIGFLCLTLLGLLGLAGVLVADKFSVHSKDSLDIVMAPNDVLREIAQPVDEVGIEEKQLASLVINTMKKADGTGLAAPQVGVLKRIIVVKMLRHLDKEEILVMVNPEIIEREGSALGKEGCLSIPGLEHAGTEWVKRSEQVTVKYRTLEGEEVVIQESGLNARVIQHEIDHLDGILIVDCASEFNLTSEILVAMVIYAIPLFIILALLLFGKKRSRVVRT